MAQVRMEILVEIADDANSGPDYGGPVTPQFLAEYLTGAGEYLFGSVRGAQIVTARVIHPRKVGPNHGFAGRVSADA